MRLLIDANLSPLVAVLLAQRGHDTLHVVDAGLLRADDLTIAHHAAQDSRVVLTSDSDFGTILARSEASSPSVVLLRRLSDRTSAQQAELIDDAVRVAHDELVSGCILTISPGRLRVRSLPIR